MRFRDRIDAAIQLAPMLEKYRNEEGVVLAVPRGGVPIGHYLAKYFNFPLELLMTKKLGLPSQPEYAIGAVTLEDCILEDTSQVSQEYVESEVKRIREELRRRYYKFMGGKQPVDLKGKTVIIVDDGIATGRTILAAIKLLRRKHPKRLVVAVPVAPAAAAEDFEELVDDFICLYTPSLFYSVSTFYDDFEQVEDDEVITLMQELNNRALTV